MIAFDAGFLSILFHPNPKLPPDPATGKPVPNAKERVEFLIDTLSNSGEKLVIPTPVLAEILIALGKARGEQAIDDHHQESAFKIEPFDEKAAIELSFMSEVKQGERKRKEQEGTWAKVKFDRQIVAIAKTSGVGMMYSTDADVLKLARKEGIGVMELHQLPSPPPSEQELPFEAPKGVNLESTEEESGSAEPVSETTKVSRGRGGSTEGKTAVKETDSTIEKD